MKRIKYICYYDRFDAQVKRNYVLSAVNKLNYIFEALNANNIGVDIISASGCVENNFVFDGSKHLKFGNNTLQLFATFGKANNGVFRVLNRWFISIQLFLYLICNVKKGEQIIVYHSLGYVKIIMMAQKFKKFSVIGEIEEIYQDVSNNYSKSVCRAEYKFFRQCSKYIFPTQLLDEKLNKEGKPHIIIHGTYKTEYDRGVRFNDEKIHVVYAGTFDPNKGGAAAAAAAEFLPENYHIHILGFGGKHDTEYMKSVINETAAKSKCAVTFDGLLKGEEYIRFLQKCQIGLSTQEPTAAFNATSFPSKILSYMANGLKVVSIRIPAIEKSAIGHCLYYYERPTPKEIYKAIMRVEVSDGKDSRFVIEELNKKFLQDVRTLIIEDTQV